MATLTDGWIALRPPERRDASAIAEAVRASLTELEPWMPWASFAYDEAAALEWIAQPGEHPFLIDDGTGRVIGSCGLHGVDALNLRANLGYWVRTDCTGRGVATAATRLLVVHGIGTLRLQRLEIVMSVHNDASRRVAERAGAIHEGVLRRRLLLHGIAHDAHSYSIVAGDRVATGDA
jgi:ribosomal-protein-serine acetyltransferase